MSTSSVNRYLRAFLHTKKKSKADFLDFCHLLNVLYKLKIIDAAGFLEAQDKWDTKDDIDYV